ncbi:MAG: hypothetical protein HDR12_15435 [Lachnospiraceae bacterium]|nr:hypothetical protein [Lachnospiraceae bacterium]
MGVIEIDAGTQIEKCEYIGEDFDTCIVSSDDIDLSKEGFVLKRRDYKHVNSTIEKNSIHDDLPILNSQYSMDIVNKKCKLVKKEDVIRHYDDWNNTRSYFYGMECTYKEMNGFIRIEPFRSILPHECMNKFTYEEFLIDRGDQYPPIKSHRYYIDISYDDVRFQRDVVTTKNHRDYVVDSYGITKEMSEEKRKQLLVEYLIKKIDKRGSDGFRPLLLGNYGYRVPDKLYSTNLDLVFDIVIPRAYELCSTGDYSRSNFLRDLINGIVNSHWLLNKGQFTSDKLWIEDGKLVYPSEDYAYFMNIQLHLKLMDKLKKREYPYTLLDVKNVYHWLACDYDKYITRHIPVYWNNKIVCGDLGDYVKKAKKKLKYFKRFG